MFVTALELVDFRSYHHLSCELGPGISVFVGSNGQGKTNLVEAIDYLATLRSHRVASEVPLVRAGADGSAIIRARVQAGIDDVRQLLLEIELNPGRPNRAKLNRAPLPRTRDLVGALRSVVFSPEDLAIVKGDPIQRRQFIDELVMARWPRMAGVRADYERVLKQRNTLLKSLAGRARVPAHGDAMSTLSVWNQQLAKFGSEVLAARLDTLAALAPHMARAYAAIAPSNNIATMTYKSTIFPESTADDQNKLTQPAVATHPIDDQLGVSAQLDPDLVEQPTSTSQVLSRAELNDVLLQAMHNRATEELARGVSLVGPHRDDLVLSLGSLPAKGYASHGESWSFALALRLGSFELLRADHVEPVLILDDVFAELDDVRRQRLAEQITSAEQVLITAAVANDVPEILSGQRFIVTMGKVSKQQEGGVDG